MKLRLLAVFIFAFILNIHSQKRDSSIDKFLISYVKDGQLKTEDVYNYTITDQSISKTSGVKHFYFRQAYNDIEVVGTESGLHLLSNGTIVSSSNNFVSNLKDKIQTTTASISAREAILKVAQQMNYSNYGALNQLRQNSYEKSKFLFSSGGISRENIPVKKVYITQEFGKPKLAWELSIFEISGENWFNFFVDANTGEIIKKTNWIQSCSNHTHADKTNIITLVNYEDKSNVIDDVDGTCAYNVFAVPLENPFYGPRTLEVDPHDITASPFGWHDTDGIDGAEFTVTRGNNANAYEDGDNFGYQPDGGADLLFDFPFNPEFSFSDQSEDAAITNLFYWTNVTHDVLYRYGFDEVSGNFQQTNYTGDGLGNDFVLAEAQDGSGSCNANFGTPPDGQNGVMQMYVCGSRDGDFDNQVIIHEYGHGISNRLTGGPSIADCLFNDEQMGEGWSDWYGSVITMTSSDLSTDLQPVGNWLFGQAQDDPGIRDFPYTTDLSQDPRTYDYIKTTFGPHPLGSTWGAMLWELTWGLIDEHGFDSDLYSGTGGNNIALALVTEGLKLQPCSPGFVDGRDAILAADIALYGGANQCVIWDAFAKRGLGFSADQGSSNSRTDGTEAFDSLSTILETPSTPFCVLEVPLVLDGGAPEGGVYSGPGVTDNNDGLTYTFDPSGSGVGIHTITYTAITPCSADGTATNTIEVTDEQPVIECQDISITLEADGTASIVPEQIVTNFLPADGYTIDQSGTFSPEDISGFGTSVTLGDDQVSSDLLIGFPFTFYTNEYSAFRVSSNGFITFDSSGDSGCCSGQNLPNTNTPNNLIAFAWQDLFPPGNGSIRYATIGTAPNRVLVVDVIDLPFCCGTTAEITAQVKLFEGTNVIEMHSTDVNGSVMTQGIENSDGSDAHFITERNAQNFSITNDYVSFTPNTGAFPSNCGFETTVTLDIDSFNCTDIGENTVTATVTDTNGNTSSCTSIVTVLPNEGVEFTLSEQIYCEDEALVTSLTGGTPIGGIYSGLGVTDDGNGETFSFDPSVAGLGIHTITYVAGDDCGNTLSASVDVEVQSAIPDIVCQDIEVTLDGTGTITIVPEQLLSGSNANIGSVELYALGLNAGIDSNIARYDYNIDTDALTLDVTYSEGTQITRNFAVDYNPNNNMVYLLSGDSGNSPRNLYQMDIESPSSSLVLVGTIVSAGGSTRPQDMAFASDGTLYFTFDTGEINSYNVTTQSISTFATVTANGAVGLTYDYDNNRLLHTTGSGPVSLTAIDVSTAAVTSLFTFNTPGSNPSCSAQGIEYIGGGKAISASTFDCDIIYTIDLNTETTVLLANPTGSFSSIKDMLVINPTLTDNCNNEPLTLSLDIDTFDCTNIGVNTVTVTATDNQGNSTSCSASVTIIDAISPELICIGDFQLSLDNNGSATLDVNDLVTSISDNCDTDIELTVSQTVFDCNDLVTSTNINLVTNGSFENGLTGWDSVIINGTGGSNCNEPWRVEMDSSSICCCVNEIDPTDGNFAAYTSFDSNIINTEYNLEQIITLPSSISSTSLSFDWLGEFDLTFGSSSLNRSFNVDIYDSNNVFIARLYNYLIPANIISSINENINIDITSTLLPHAGENIKFVFNAFIPDSSTGPSKSLIDNIQLLVDGSTNFVDVLVTATDASNNISECTTRIEILDPLNSCNLSVNSPLEENNIAIYPNPTSGLVTLKWNNNDLNALDIYDINGRLVLRESLKSNGSSDTKTIDLSPFDDGIYILNLKSDKASYYKRLVIKR